MKASLKTIWENRKGILEGIKNSIVKDEFVEDVARMRHEICNNCELKGDECVVKGTSPCCNECGCSLAFKTRSLSSLCPHPDGAKWKAIATEEEEDELDNLKD
jgi:hypothetical protein